MKNNKQEKPIKKHRVLKTILVLFVCIVIAGGATLAYLFMGFGKYDPAKLENDPQSTLLFDQSDELALSVHGAQNRVVISIDAMPQQLKDAFVAAEDLRFYKHQGFDIVRILGALWADLRAGNLQQGASTITQQLVKNTHLTSEKTFMRKLKEAYFAYQIEQDYNKDQILAMYMNHVYLGNGAYGVQAAAQSYFGVDVSELNLAQCASLAAILKAPSNYAPHIKPENNKKRRDLIISIMQDEGFISQGQAETAKEYKLQTTDQSLENTEHSWFTDAALEEASILLDIEYEQMLSGGYKIYTTLDTKLQEDCEELLKDPALFPADAIDGVQVQSAIVVTTVGTGEIRALIGGRDYQTLRGLNRATQMKRQPGSTLKPFAVYAPALERYNYTTTTFVNDVSTDFGGYRPRNFGDTYKGIVTIRTAIARSLNVPAVTILNEIGVGVAREYISAFGLPLDDNDIYLPLALGSMTQGVSPLELCSAYAALGNEGRYVAPTTIRRIEDPTGNTIYTATIQEKQAVTASTAYLLSDALRSTAQWGTASKIGATGLTVAAKTGTVAFEGDLNRDAWAAAYTPSTALTVWMGFDTTDQNHAMGKSVTGGGLPSGLAAKVLSLAQQADQPFTVPADVHWVTLDKKALEVDHVVQLATQWTPASETIADVFRAGTEPTQYSVNWMLPSTPIDLRVVLNSSNLPSIEFTILDDFARYRLFRSMNGDTAVDIMQFDGKQEQKSITYSDATVERGATYSYYILPENAQSVDLGMENAKGQPTYTVSVTVPGLPFDLPFGLDELFIPQGKTAIPSETPASLETPSVTLKPTVTPSTSALSPAKPTNVATPSAKPVVKPTIVIKPSPTPMPTPKPTTSPKPTPNDKPLFVF